MMTSMRRLIASTLIVSCSLTSLSAQAVIVPTEALLQGEEASSTTMLSPEAARTRVSGFLARDDVRQALMGQGVDAEAAQARVAALSDAEVAELDGRIATAPAGGEVLGLLFTIFVILLVTDILGFTKIFPFTRSIR